MDDEVESQQPTRHRRGIPLLSVEELIAGCQSLQASKGELLLRRGEEPRSVLVILSGVVRVFSQADNTVERKPRAASANAGYLEAGDWLGALTCLKQARSQFSYAVATPQGLVAKVIPAGLFRDKVVPQVPESYWNEQEHTEAQWNATADDAKRVSATQRREDIAAERKGNFGKLQHYHIPDRLRVRCCPDLSKSAAAIRRQDPPPPHVQPTLQDAQREIRAIYIHEYAQEESESDSSSSDSEKDELEFDPFLNSRSGKRGAFQGLGLVALLHVQERGQKHSNKHSCAEHLWQAEAEAKAKAKGKAKAKSGPGRKFVDWKPIFHPRRLPLSKWKETREYEVLEHVPVLMPEMFNTEDVLEMDMLARKRKALFMNVMRQVRIAVKSGVREVNGIAVTDAESLFRALDRDGSGSIDATELAAGLARFVPGITQSDVEEVIKIIDTDGDESLDIGELVIAVEQPKSLFSSSPAASKAPSAALDASLHRSLRSTLSSQDVTEVAQEVQEAYEGMTKLREYNEEGGLYSQITGRYRRPKSANWAYEFEPKEPITPRLHQAMSGRQRPRSANANKSSLQRHAAESNANNSSRPRHAAASMGSRAFREGALRHALRGIPNGFEATTMLLA